MPAEHRPQFAPPPVPLSRSDCSTPTIAALTSAADQLREHAVVFACGGTLPPELSRGYDGVTAGPLYAVAEWLEARAAMYGWRRPEPEPVTVIGFEGQE